MLRLLLDLREIPNAPFARHPWEVARADFFVRAVCDHVASDPVTVLDVGGGDGYVARRLLQALPFGSQVTCVDPNYTDEQLNRLHADRPPGLFFTREAAGSTADWVLLLDVLEHVVDDRALLGDMASRLRSGGHALLSVPAWPGLFTQHDVMLGHHRRYVPGQLDRVAEMAGLERIDGGSLFSSLLLPRAAAKALERLRGLDSCPLSAAASDHAQHRRRRLARLARVDRGDCLGAPAGCSSCTRASPRGGAGAGPQRVVSRAQIAADTMSARACCVIPCHNEAARLDEQAFLGLVDDEPAIDLLFVNDGSRDGTQPLLASLAARRPQRIRALSLQQNVGKAEAVRSGLLEALRGAHRRLFRRRSGHATVGDAPLGAGHGERPSRRAPRVAHRHAGP